LAARGFLQEWNSRGFAQIVQERVLTGDAEDSGLLTKSGETPVAVVAIGTEATSWVLRHSTGCVVFCMVANPRQKVLAGLSEAQANRVNGVSLNVPVADQLQLLRDVLPQVKRVGVIFNPNESDDASQEAAKAAERLGLQLITKPVHTEADLPEATAWIARRIDLLWAPLDDTVFNNKSAQFVLYRMLQRSVPVMGFSESMAKAGALLAVRLDYGDIGRQAAELLATALSRGRTASGVIESPRGRELVVNAHVSRLLHKPIQSQNVVPVRFIHED
jgi:putative ABC transport system substrate-binding protein